MHRIDAIPAPLPGIVVRNLRVGRVRVLLNFPDFSQARHSKSP